VQLVGGLVDLLRHRQDLAGIAEDVGHIVDHIGGIVEMNREFGQFCFQSHEFRAGGHGAHP